MFIGLPPGVVEVFCEKFLLNHTWTLSNKIMLVTNYATLNF